MKQRIVAITLNWKEQRQNMSQSTYLAIMVKVSLCQEIVEHLPCRSKPNSTTDWLWSLAKYCHCSFHSNGISCSSFGDIFSILK